MERKWGEKMNRGIEIWREISTISSRLLRESEKQLNDKGISIVEFRILRDLNERGDMPMVKLAKLNFITQGWTTSLVDRLEQKGYVQRTRSSLDRRVINISSTEKGSEFYSTIKCIHESFVNESLKFLTDEEENTLMLLLKKIDLNLEKSFDLISEVKNH
jgi:DNA-binding MarR family transcriptional regulator